MADHGAQAGAGVRNTNSTWPPQAVFPPPPQYLGAGRPTLNPATLNDLLLLEHAGAPRCAPHMPPARTHRPARRQGVVAAGARLVGKPEMRAVGSGSWRSPHSGRRCLGRSGTAPGSPRDTPRLCLCAPVAVPGPAAGGLGRRLWRGESPQAGGSEASSRHAQHAVSSCVDPAPSPGLKSLWATAGR